LPMGGGTVFVCEQGTHQHIHLQQFGQIANLGKRKDYIFCLSN
jgi:hypothetical protein